ncbi:MAG: hypothetical protein LW689_06150 [Novosphingobium sp.]|jgi:hypothetical protein|nr:hypothetical protein [Novosphingobium sp.]MCE2842349.1 hypothetical protein [Novosphingobium sp.]
MFKIQTKTKQVLRVHVGYKYMLLDPTPENFALAQWLMSEPSYTTVYNGDFHFSVHALENDKRTVATLTELITVKLVDMTELEYNQAVADKPENDT